MNNLLAALQSIDITPPDFPRLGRLGVNILIPNRIHWPLTARLALFEQEGVRLALCIADLNVMLTASATELREAVARGARLPVENVLFGWTHTHNAPTVWPWLTQDPDFTYLDFVATRIESMASGAVAALQPCRLRAGHIEAPGIAINRRPRYALARGRIQVGTHGALTDPAFAGMEGPDGSDLRVVQLIAESGEPLGGLVNFAMHPTCTYAETLYSADYPGPLRARLEEQAGGTWMYLNGPAGNLSPTNALPGEPPFSSGTEKAERIGAHLAQHALRALAQASDLPIEKLGARCEWLSIPQRPLARRQVEIARDYLDHQARQTPWPGILSEDLYGYAFHFHHRSAAVDDWLARDILGMWEWRRRVGARELMEAVPIQTFRIGDLGLAAFPCELFTEYSQPLRAASPFPTTLLVQMANGWHGYIPPPQAFDHGGYECCFALQSRLVPDAGDRMTSTAGRLLMDLAH